MKILELSKKFSISNDSKHELQKRLDQKIETYQSFNNKLEILKKHCQTNPFNFYNTLKDDDDGIDLGNFLNTAENNITLYDNEPIFSVITDTSEDKYRFILKNYTTINDSEPVEINRFFKDVDQLTQSIAKMVDRYVETLEVLFSGEMIKCTLLFNKVKRSD